MARPITALIIMDGFGLRDDAKDNAIKQQGTPFITSLMNEYPSGAISASGMDVGLPDGQMGNSEVGHQNLGAGRVVVQEFTRITKFIRDGSFFSNPVLVKACQAAKGHKLHLMGLVSDGGVHSHVEHLLALVDMAKAQGLPDVYIHAFMDGRDVPPASGREFLAGLDAELKKRSFGKIATVSGRYYAMDRDTQWDRVQKAWEAMYLGLGDAAENAKVAMIKSYEKDVFDEFVKPTVIVSADRQPVATISDGDAIIFFNFRPDRARELSQAIIHPDFDKFPRAGGHRDVHFVSMTQYDATFTNVGVAYMTENTKSEPRTTMGETLAANGKTQLRIAETTKYAHVTYFFNGGTEKPNKGEDRALIPTPEVATFDLKPEMSAYEIAAEAVKRIESGVYDAMILNFANCDMVGHTGIMDAAKMAVKAVDDCVKLVVTAALASGGQAIVTADHGNADLMVDQDTDEPFTAHTTNPVPFIVVDPRMKGRRIRAGGRLADVSPTMLELMGIAKPAEMSGESLLTD